jgi:hypothetical protein
MATKRLLNAVQNTSISKRNPLSRRRLRSMIQVGQLVTESTLERSDAQYDTLDLRTEKEKAALLLWVQPSNTSFAFVLTLSTLESGRRVC